MKIYSLKYNGNNEVKVFSVVAKSLEQAFGRLRETLKYTGEIWI